MGFGGRQDILSVLLNTRLGLVVIQSMCITCSESSHCFLSRDLVPFQVCNIFDMTFSGFYAVCNGIGDIDTQSSVS